VVLEAAIVGLIGSALGIAGGVGLAYGLTAVMNAAGLGVPSGSLELAPRTIIVALVLGVVVTTVSAYAPARRAAKVPPVEAMREQFASTGDSLRVRTIIGALLGVLGVVLVIVGSLGTGAGAASTVGIGALALILAAVLAGPWISRPIVGTLGAVLTKPFGQIGRLARNNAVRNPRRTAATAFALTLGLLLVSVIGVFGASAKASVNRLVDQGVRADYLVVGPQTQLGIPLTVRASVKAVPGVADTVAFRVTQAKLGDTDISGMAVSGDPSKVMRYDMADGSPDVVNNDLIASKTEAATRNWKIGDAVTLATADGHPVPVKVTGIYEDTPVMGAWVVSSTTYEQLTAFANRADNLVMVKAAPGADMAALRAGLEKAVKSYSTIKVQDREEYKGEQAKQIDILLNILYALLALAIVIAILGIINTLALSVVERRREIGMLRAVGTMRAQVRRTIYLESLLIALFGAIVGIVLGLGIGTGFMRTLREQGLGQIAIPWGQVGFMLIASAVVGVLAALWPAIRAARTRPLEAIIDL
jgi:putative ABC transport system permease protein